jgi:hypothetical protein
MDRLKSFFTPTATTGAEQQVFRPSAGKQVSKFMESNHIARWTLYTVICLKMYQIYDKQK